MKTYRNTISAIGLGFALSLAGCSGKPILRSGNTGQHVPPDGIVLAPNEKITLNALAAKRREYFCDNGAALRCERFGLKLYCSCPNLISPR